MVEKGDRWRSAKCVLSFAQLCWRCAAKSPSCQEPLFEKCTAEWRVSFLAAPHGACANLRCSNFLASQHLGRKSCLCRPWGIAKGTIQGWSFKKKQTCWLSTTSWQSVDTESLLQELLDHIGPLAVPSNVNYFLVPVLRARTLCPITGGWVQEKWRCRGIAT